jgi:hypothetical protein
MKSETQRKLFAAVLALLVVIPLAPAGEKSFGSTGMDSAFSAGLAKLKHATGFIEDPPGQSQADWKPNLQLLVGVKAVEGSKHTIHFVELTTVQPPLTNAIGQPWQPLLRTNGWAWSPTNKTQFISSNYPVRVRVFDGAGRLLKGGQAPMAWGVLTNGLLDLCRFSLETYGNPTNRALTPSRSRPTGEGGRRTGEGRPQPDERLMLATGGGFLWMIGMFGDLQTVPTVADVWAKAQCTIRWPSAWTILTAPIKGMTLDLLPRTEEVTLSSTPASAAAGLHYCLPVDLMSGKRQLCRVEIVVGPAHGAEMLLAGIRTIHARHPIKPKQEFLTQVLATGRVREP